MAEDIDELTLAEALGEELDEAPEAFHFSRPTTGRFNATWFVESGNGPLVVRVAPPDDRSRMLFYEHRMMRQEPQVHECILERTTVPVPRVVACRRAGGRLDRDFIVFERLRGEPLTEAGGAALIRVDTVLAQLGQALRQVHAITGPLYGYLGAHRPMEPERTWQEAFMVMWGKLLDDIERCSGYARNEIEAMRRLPDLYAGVFENSRPACLLHMDVWGENILVDDLGKLTGLLDWDRALWGDPEIEFAVLDYCGLSGPAFWEGYGEQRADGREARIRKVFYLLYEIQKYIVIYRARHHDPIQADIYRRNALELARVLMR